LAVWSFTCPTHLSPLPPSPLSHFSTHPSLISPGRLINLHDWWQSFSNALDARGEADNSNAPCDESDDGKKQDKKKGKKKQRTKQRAAKSAGGSGSGSGSVKAQQKVQRQRLARFVRCVSELKGLGFVRVTGRKADHVIRLVFGMGLAK
jgi:origin recognition complex subunit 3